MRGIVIIAGPVAGGVVAMIALFLVILAVALSCKNHHNNKTTLNAESIHMHAYADPVYEGNKDVEVDP